jgi:hypothetical protein
MIGSLWSLLISRDPNGKVWLQTIVHHARICPMVGVTCEISFKTTWASVKLTNQSFRSINTRIRKVNGLLMARNSATSLLIPPSEWWYDVQRVQKTSFNFQSSTNGKCAESARNGLKELPKPKFFDTGSIGSGKFRNLHCCLNLKPNARSSPRWCPNFGLNFGRVY